MSDCTLNRYFFIRILLCQSNIVEVLAWVFVTYMCVAMLGHVWKDGRKRSGTQTVIMPWPWGEQANHCWLHLSTVSVWLTAGKRRIEYGVLMWISAVYQWLCYLSEEKRERLMGSSKWKMTSHCWLWLFRAHSLPLETNMKQNAVILVPRAEGIKHWLTWYNHIRMLCSAAFFKENWGSCAPGRC